MKDPLIHFPFYCHDMMGLTSKYTLEQQGAFFRVLSGFITEDGTICEKSKYRLFQAQTKSEQNAVDFVLSHAKELAIQIIKKQKPVRQKNRDNGKKGGRPPKPTG